MPAAAKLGSPQWIEKQVKDVLGHDDDDRKTLLAGKMLIAALIMGPNADAIAKYLDAPRQPCREIAVRLRENGIWRGSVMNIGDWVEEGSNGGDIVFILHALAGAGQIVAVEDDGEERKWYSDG